MRYAQLVLPLVAAVAFGADTAKVWSHATLERNLSTAKPDAHQIRVTSLEGFGGYRLSVSMRGASGRVELHQKVDDVFFVESGEATLITGGQIVGAKTTASHEVRGVSIHGGTTRKLGAGDVVRIPANVPHQFLLDAGKQITYAVVKVDAR